MVQAMSICVMCSHMSTRQSISFFLVQASPIMDDPGLILRGELALVLHWLRCLSPCLRIKFQKKKLHFHLSHSVV